MIFIFILKGYTNSLSEFKDCMDCFDRFVKLHQDDNSNSSSISNNNQSNNQDPKDVTTMTNVQETHRDQDMIDVYLDKIANTDDPDWSGERGYKRLLGAIDSIPLGADAVYLALR